MRRVVFVKDYDVEGVIPRNLQTDPVVTIPCGIVIPKGVSGYIIEGSDVSYPDVLLDLGFVVRGIPEAYVEPGPLESKAY